MKYISKYMLCIIIIVICILSFNTISATDTITITTDSGWSTQPEIANQCIGLNSTANMDFWITSVTKPASTTATQSRIWHGNNTLMGTANFSGNDATFSPAIHITNGQVIYITMSSTIPFTSSYKGYTHPASNQTYFTTVARLLSSAGNCDNVGQQTGYISDIISINVSATNPEGEETPFTFTDDAYVLDTSPDTNYGTEAVFGSSGYTNDRTGFFEINLSDYYDNPNIQLKGVYVSLYGTTPWGTGTVTTRDWYFCRDGFNETYITYNNMASEVTDCEADYFYRNLTYFTNAIHNVTIPIEKINLSVFTIKITENTGGSANHGQAYGSKEETNMTQFPRIILTYDTGYHYQSMNYDNETLEGSNEAFTSNVLFNSSLVSSISANLIYNGTTYTSSATNNSTHFVFSKTLLMPLISETYGTNKSFYWAYTITFTNSSTTTYNTSSTNQTVHRMVLDQATGTCGANTPYNLSNFTFADELTSTGLGSVTSIINLIMRNPDNPTLTRVFSDVDTSGAFRYCYHWADSEHPFSIIANYSKISRTNYTDRANHLCENITGATGTVSSTTQYLLSNASDYQKFYFTIKNINQQVLSNYFVKIEKMISPWGFLSQRLTDAFGVVVERLIPDESYRITIYDNNCTQVKQETLTLVCQATPCTYDLVLTNLTNPFEVIEELPNFAYSWDWDKTTKILTLGYEDQGAGINQVTLRLYNKTIGEGDTLTCTNSSVASSDSLTCNLSSYNSGTFIAYMDAETDDATFTRWYNFGINLAKEIFGTETLIWGALIITTLFFVGIWNPVVAVVFALIGVIITAIIGFIALQWVAFILIIAVFVIIIIKLRS